MLKNGVFTCYMNAKTGSILTEKMVLKINELHGLCPPFATPRSLVRITCEKVIHRRAGSYLSLQRLLQNVEFVVDFRVLAAVRCDLSYRMQYRRMVASTEQLADFRQAFLR
jgi:hypothetical protein